MSKSAQDRLLQGAWKHADIFEEEDPPERGKVSPLWFAVVALALVMSYVLVARAERPEGMAVDPTVSAWFQSLNVPAGPKQGWGCCNAADCRTVAYRTRGTTFQAFIKKGTRRDGDAFSDGDDQWHDVPEEHVLHGSSNPVGEAVACWFQHQILCFVLPSLT